MKKKMILLHNQEIIHYFEREGQIPLLLLHGNFSGAQFFDDFIETLDPMFHIIAPDMRGFGDSSYYQRFDSLKELAEDMIDLLQQKNIQKVNILGWSLGGGVAMEIAARHEVNRLILINSTSHKGYPVFKKDATGKALDQQVYESKDQMAFDPIQVAPVLYALEHNYFEGIKYLYDHAIFTVNQPTSEQEKRWYYETLKQRCLVDADWALANQNMSNEENPYRQGDNTVKNIQCPTLHVWGKSDITTPEYMIEANALAIKNSTRLTYENCGHSPFTDVPKQLALDIKNFILG
jgi:pimeloyl-ACP methyl ester carboxylesterase